MAATLHASKGTRGQLWSASPKHARAIYELGLSPLSLSTITTLSGSHVIEGAAVAMSSLGSGLAIAMMWWVAVGRPPWPRGLVQTGSRAPGWAPSCSVGGPLSTSNPQPPELKHGLIAWPEGASVL